MRDFIGCAKSQASADIRDQIISLVRKYYENEHIRPKYKEGDPVNYAGRVYDHKELENLVDASLEFWLTSGRWGQKFEKELSQFLGVNYCSLVNSGSSANLLAFMALTSPKIGEKRRIKKGDEVITVAAAFPTTVAPVIQYGAVPVFVDVELETCNIDISLLESALSEKTRAVMIAHTLGNPFNLEAVKKFCDSNGLWLVEDNCDSLGSRYLIDGKWKYTGAVGDIGTSSFYPPHHITMGEGGAVYTNDFNLKKIVDSLRDWGRDCWCPSGHDGTCGGRFGQRFGELPPGYDHKYVYSHFGYNLKATDMQAAIGCAQLEKLPGFIEARRRNWEYLRNALREAEKFLILPEAAKNSQPSWFGFLVTVKENSPYTRDQIVKYLEDRRIQTRMLFAGNIIKHPCFDEMRGSKKGFRIAGNLSNTEIIMNRSFWVGVYPGMEKPALDYVSNTILSRLTKQ